MKPYKALDENMGKFFYNLSVEKQSYDRRQILEAISKGYILSYKNLSCGVWAHACTHTHTHHKESKNTNYNFMKTSETISQRVNMSRK